MNDDHAGSAAVTVEEPEAPDFGPGAASPLGAMAEVLAYHAGADRWIGSLERAAQTLSELLDDPSLAKPQAEQLRSRLERIQTFVANVLEHATGPMGSLAHQNIFPQRTRDYIKEEHGHAEEGEMTLAAMDVCSIWGDLRTLYHWRSASTRDKVEALLDAGVALNDAFTITMGVVLNELIPPPEPEPVPSAVPTDGTEGTDGADGADTDAEPAAPPPDPDPTVTKVVDALGLVTCGLSTMLVAYRYYHKLSAMFSGKREGRGTLQAVDDVMTDVFDTVHLFNSCMTTIRQVLTLANDFIGSDTLAAEIASSASPWLGVPVVGSIKMMRSAYRGLNWAGFNLVLRYQRTRMRKWMHELEAQGTEGLEEWEKFDPERMAHAMAAHRHITRILTKRELKEVKEFTLGALLTVSACLYASGYGAPIPFTLQLVAVGTQVGLAVLNESKHALREVQAQAYQRLQQKESGQWGISTKEKRELRLLLEDDAVAPTLALTPDERAALFEQVPTARTEKDARDRWLDNHERKGRELDLLEQLVLDEIEQRIAAADGQYFAKRRARFALWHKGAPSKIARAQQLLNRLRGDPSLSAAGRRKLDRFEAELELRRTEEAKWQGLCSRLTPNISIAGHTLSSRGNRRVDLTADQRARLDDEIPLRWALWVHVKPNWTHARSMVGARHFKHALTIVSLNPASAAEGAVRSKLIMALTRGNSAAFEQAASKASTSSDAELLGKVMQALYKRRLSPEELKSSLHAAGLDDVHLDSYVDELSAHPAQLMELLMQPEGKDVDDEYRRRLRQALRMQGQKVLLAEYLVGLMQG